MVACAGASERAAPSEIGVHDQVFVLGGDGSLEVLESCKLDFAAEDLSVEFDGFAGVALEGEIGVELDSHGWPFSKSD